MIKIKDIGKPTITMEGAMIIEKATALQEHQIAQKLLKFLYNEGFYGEVMTDAKLNEKGDDYVE